MAAAARAAAPCKVLNVEEAPRVSSGHRRSFKLKFGFTTVTREMFADSMAAIRAHLPVEPKTKLREVGLETHQMRPVGAGELLSRR